jgi:catecholate siderophore receptor
MLGACALPALADTLDLPATRVDGKQDRYKVDTVTSSKITTPLLDAPQSISVVPRAVLEEQNAQSLQEVLRNVPGITFMSGEGNLGWGDLFSIRGFAAEQSMTVDGVRDAGMASRNDTFNLEQAEVYKGTGSVESGVSAVGGSVNLVSKRAHLGDAGKLSAGIGTDNYKRLTADVNRQLNDTSAVRVNLMKHYNAVSERDEVDYDRWGLATSFGFGLGTDTRLWLDAFYQKDRNTPDGGVPIQRGTDGKRMPGVDRDAWYGDSSLYTQRSETRSLTGLFEHDFSDDLTLRNQLRWQQTDNWACCRRPVSSPPMPTAAAPAPAPAAPAWAMSGWGRAARSTASAPTPTTPTAPVATATCAAATSACPSATRSSTTRPTCASTSTPVAFTTRP